MRIPERILPTETSIDNREGKMSFETISQNDRELQKNLYFIAELLGVLRRSRRATRQRARVESEISAATERLEYLIHEYQDTLRHGTTQEAHVHRLASRPVCDDCRRKRTERRTVSKRAETTVMELPLWQPALDFAVACTRSVANDFLSSQSLSVAEHFPLCVVRLRSVLRHLQDLSAIPTQGPELGLSEPWDHCADCEKPIEAELGQK